MGAIRRHGLLRRNEIQIDHRLRIARFQRQRAAIGLRRLLVVARYTMRITKIEPRTRLARRVAHGRLP
jgi:hypothetical protein